MYSTSGGRGGGGGGGGGGVCVCATLSGGAILHLALLVSVWLCCSLLNLNRLHAISVVTMMCDRPVH